MKGKFCLIVSLLILFGGFIIQEKNIADTIHIRKIMKIGAPRSKSPRDRQWGGREPPQAPGPNAV
ncbi:hypothetical protein BRARA_C02138 [Brassica rapa]|uniref:Uncharacterized protein n=1 Tax=Brassica campestris TaxID=3711 RepID=A0A397ZYP2_BRACM|nr:hypothetical protein BRARA_C02138 [Brassica rapa]